MLWLLMAVFGLGFAFFAKYGGFYWFVATHSPSAYQSAQTEKTHDVKLPLIKPLVLSLGGIGISFILYKIFENQITRSFGLALLIVLAVYLFLKVQTYFQSNTKVIDIIAKCLLALMLLPLLMVGFYLI